MNINNHHFRSKFCHNKNIGLAKYSNPKNKYQYNYYHNNNSVDFYLLVNQY